MAIVGRASVLSLTSVLIRGFMQSIYTTLSVEYSTFQSLLCRSEKRKWNKGMHFERKFLLFCFRVVTIFLCFLSAGGIWRSWKHLRCTERWMSVMNRWELIYWHCLYSLPLHLILS